MNIKHGWQGDDTAHNTARRQEDSQKAGAAEEGSFVTNRRPRNEFSKATKIRAWDRSGGHCEECGAKLFTGKFIYDHRIPTALGGDASLENCKVQCTNCDKPKTANDQTTIAKARRAEEKHLGVREPRGHAMPGSRKSKWKSQYNRQTKRFETVERT